MGSQVPAQLSRERSQEGFPAPSPLLMENLQPGSTLGSVISVGMLNQHLAIGTEGMELGGLWWPPRRDTRGTGVTQQCLTVEGAIPMAGNTGGKLAAQHPLPVCCSRTSSSPASLSCHFGNAQGWTEPPCTARLRTKIPFTAWMLHPRMLKVWDARASSQLCPGSPLALTAAINFLGSGMAGPAPRQIQPVLRG